MGVWMSKPVCSPQMAVPSEAVDMDSAQYSLRNISTPVLRGWMLWAFVKAVVDTFVWSLMYPKMFRDSGFDSVLRMGLLPEPPCYEPLLVPAEVPDSVHATSIRGAPAERANQAAKICTGPAAGRLTSRPRIRDFNDAYRSAKITPTDAIQATLERVRASEAMSPPMRFFIAIDEADVLQQAAASTQRWKEGRPLSILDGVPMAVKDDTDQLPYQTTMGTTFVADIHKVTRNAQHVDALKAAGVILLGKANMHEIGQGVTGWNTHYGPARNPHNPNHFTGGSSSGSAALVAAGLCPVAIGADGGGSIRIPAAFCGLYGLIPTYGRTKEDHKSIKITNTMGTTGPIAGCMEDLSIVYAVISNLVQTVPRPSCPRGYVLPPPIALPSKWPKDAQECSLTGIRVGIYREYFEHADQAVVKACYDAVHTMQDMGAELIPIKIPELESARVAHACLISSEMYHFYSHLAECNPGLWQRLGLDVQVTQKSSGTFLASDVIQSQKIRARATVFYSRLFEKVDVIVTPTTAITAPRIHPGVGKHGESNLPQLGGIMRFIFSANLIGLPAISVPVACDDKHMPIGLQIMGRPWSEATVIDCARKLELTMQAKTQMDPAVSLGVLGNLAA